MAMRIASRLRALEPDGTFAAIAPASAAARRSFRLSLAHHDAPLVLVLSGILLVAYSTVAYLVDPSGGLIAHVADLPTGVLLIVVGLVLSRSRVPDPAVPWIVAAMALLVVLSMLVEVWRAPAGLATAYVLLVICAFGPPMLSWTPFLVVTPIMIVAVGVVTATWTPTEWIDWMAAATAAAMIGALMLAVRLRSVYALADAIEEVQRRAVTDELTGLFNRHGLDLQLPPMVAYASRYHQPLFAAFIDIDGLKQANDRFGHEFGDEVISCVAKAVAGTVREGDLVTRWGGDELLVVGIGPAPDDAALAARLGDAISQSGINLDQWSGTVSLGFAEVPPTRIDVEQLIAAADADMYRRRLNR